MVLMTASVKLYAGKLPEFISLLNDIQPLLAKHGWKLQGSYASIVWRLNTVLDLWEFAGSQCG